MNKTQEKERSETKNERISKKTDSQNLLQPTDLPSGRLEMKFWLKNLDELSPRQLNDLMKLRQDVFVVEQNCPYPDLDRLDWNCRHLILWDENQMIGCARIIPAGLVFKEASIGRICLDPACRKNGWGRALMKKALQVLREEGQTAVRIHGQAYLKDFYQSLGFEPTGEPFDEDGIPHIEFLLNF